MLRFRYGMVYHGLREKRRQYRREKRAYALRGAVYRARPCETFYRGGIIRPPRNLHEIKSQNTTNIGRFPRPFFYYISLLLHKKAFCVRLNLPHNRIISLFIRKISRIGNTAALGISFGYAKSCVATTRRIVVRRFGGALFLMHTLA